MIFLSVLVFAFTLYVLPIAPLIHQYFVLFPFLGKDVSYILVSLIILGLLHLIIFALNHWFSNSIPTYGRWMTELTRRTGIPRFDMNAFLFSLLAIATLFLLSRDQMPLAIACAIAFGRLMLQPIKLRPVSATRAAVAPPFLPPEAGIPPSEQPVKEEDKERFLLKVYTWAFELHLGQTPYPTRMELTVDARRYSDYQTKNPCNVKAPRNEEIVDFANKGATGEVVLAAAHFIKLSRKKGLSLFHELCNVLSFVQQSIPYKTDEESKGKEYFRYPIETFVDEQGDCDCKSILAASLYQCMGHGVVLLVKPGEFMRPGHAALAVEGAEGIPGTFILHKGKKYYFCETTADGWRVGEVPPDVNLDEFKRLEMWRYEATSEEE